MALKIRGSSQIQSNSIEFAQIQKISPARILGLSEDSKDGDGNPLSAAPTELQATDIRKIANLWEDDAPDFNGLTLTKIGDPGSQTGGNLDVEGTGNIDGDFTILKNDADASLTKFKITATNGNLSTLGSMTSQDDIKLITSDDIEKHALASDGTLTSLGKIKSKSSFEVVKIEGDTTTSKFEVDNNGNLTSAGTGTFTGNVVSGDATGTHVKLEASTGKVLSSLLEVGGLDGDNNPAKLIVDANGDVSIDKDLTVTGTLSVGDINTLGTVTQIDTEHLHVKDSLIMLADGNDATDLLDIGFVGKSSAGHHGLVRDADDSIFKLFQNSSEDLSSDNSVNFDQAGLEYGHLHLNKITLMGDGKKFIGDLQGTADKAAELTTNRSFSIGTSAGDTGDITATGVNFNGSANVELSATINTGAVDFAHLNAAAVVLSTEGLVGSADSDVTIPTSKAVAAYVNSKVSSGGFANVSNMDLQMGYVEDNGTESFVRVYETVVLHKVKDYQAGGMSVYNEETHQTILINGIDTSPGQDGSGFGTNPEFDSKLDGKLMLFVNGQKLRIGTSVEVGAGTADYYIDVQPGDVPQQTGERSCIKFGADTIAINDELEIRYYNKY